MTNISIQDRINWIGASEVASLFYMIERVDGKPCFIHMFERVPEGATILGCLSRHTPGYRLWCIKAGLIEADNLDNVERVQAGQHLEPAIAAWSRDKWPDEFGTLQKVHRYTAHPAISGLGASRDYELKAPGMPPVEIKNVDGLVFADQWKADGDIITAPPMDITLQVQHQIAADGSKADHGIIVACVRGNELKHGRIEAHAPTIAKIEEAVSAFWKSIADGEPPAEFADIETVNELYLSGDPKEPPADLTGDNMMPILCRHYKRLNDMSKRIDMLKDRKKAQIALKIGDARKAVYATGTITYPIVNRKASVKEIKASTYRGGMTIKETQQ